MTPQGTEAALSPMHKLIQGGTFGIDLPGITLTGGRPSVTVLLGPDERESAVSLTSPHTVNTCEIQTPLGPAEERRCTWHDPHGYAFTWIVRALRNVAGVTLQGIVHNRTDESVRLREITLCATGDEGLVCEGRPEDWWLSTVEYSQRIGNLATVLPSINKDTECFWAGFGLPVPFALPDDERSTDGHWRTFRDALTLFPVTGNAGLVVGAVGPAEAFVSFHCHVNAGRMRLHVISEMDDVVVGPGEFRQSEEVLVLAGEYRTSMERLFGWIADTHGRRTHHRPPVGWCSWYDKMQDVTARDVQDLLDAAEANRDRLPLDVIQIDDGFQRQVGDWACNDKFAEGWEPIVSRIRALGAMPGIWLAPLAVHDSLGFLERHPDWFQRNAAGELQGEASNWGPKSHWLDPTHPEVQQFIRAMIRQARKDGFTYFKIDFNTIEGRLWDAKKTRLQAHRDLYRLYREEIGEDGYLLACSQAQSTRGVVGMADAVRIGMDSGPVWHGPNPCCIAECIRAVGQTALENGHLFINDPDVSYTLPRGGLNDDEQRTWHSMVGLLGGLVFISEPMKHPEYAASARMLEILTPPAPERGWSMRGGWDGTHQQFGFVAERPWGRFASVLLHNAQDDQADLALDMRDLSALGEVFHAWSFWDGQYLGVVGKDFTARHVAPHAPMLLRLTPGARDDAPVLVGSDLHISMGAAEIAEMAMTPKQLTITMTDAGAREGNLYLYSQQPLVLVEATGCHAELVPCADASLWRVQLDERQRGVMQILRLCIERDM